ncbi:MAG TPA: ankyrin repeat domain-containing protein, partial [Candidatus Babeliaceae bacterium]|nr:ankyrin repeat domain-containing protein [Candidatus Babeliaceae bacterium]
PEQLNVSSDEGLTALYYAVMLDRGYMAYQLLGYGADINAIDDLGETVLHHAVIENNEQAVRFLLEFHPDILLANKEGLTPLQIAQKLKFSGIVRILELYALEQWELALAPVKEEDILSEFGQNIREQFLKSAKIIDFLPPEIISIIILYALGA